MRQQRNMRIAAVSGVHASPETRLSLWQCTCRGRVFAKEACALEEEASLLYRCVHACAESRDLAASEFLHGL